MKPNFTFKIKFFLLVISSIPFTGCSGVGNPVTETELVMGTTCSVTLYRHSGSEIFHRVFDRIKEIDRKMAVQKEESEVSEINREAGVRAVSVSEDTFRVVERAVEISRVSGGAFDITVGPLVQLWGIGTERAGVPEEEEIKALLPVVDYRKIQLNREELSVFLEERGMALDLGAIAKGFAVDEAVEVLGRNGVERGIINLGGNIYAYGEKPEGKPWRIGVQNPEGKPGTYIGILEVINKTMATSGVYERYFIRDNTRYHHILDPETGYPVRNGLESVTVLAEDSMDADALSTAVFCLGLQAGMELVERSDGTEAVFITDDKTVILSSGLQGRFELTDRDFVIGRTQIPE